MRWIVRVSMAVVALAAVAGCGMAEARMCRQAGEAELCLVEQGAGFRMTGQGFQAGSELHVTMVGAPPPAVERSPWLAGGDGKVPGPGALFIVSRGPDSQHLAVAATSAGGQAVRFEFTVPPAAGTAG